MYLSFNLLTESSERCKLSNKTVLNETISVNNFKNTHFWSFEINPTAIVHVTCVSQSEQRAFAGGWIKYFWGDNIVWWAENGRNNKLEQICWVRLALLVSLESAGEQPCIYLFE